MRWDWDRELRVEQLLEAARQGETGRVLALLDAGLDVNAVGPIRDTALSHATAGRHPATMQALLNRGADTEIANTRCETPLTWALIQNGAWPGWRIAEPDARPLEILHAAGARYRLYEAVLLDDLDLARTRLAEGADPDYALGSYHGSVLQIASTLGFAGMVALLLDHGASVGITDDLCQTPLVRAADGNHLAVVRLLLGRGADPNAQNYAGIAALTIARVRGQTALVRLLLDYGASWTILDALEMDDVPLLATLVDAEIAQIVAKPTEDLSLIDEDDPALKYLRRSPVDQIDRDRIAQHAAGLGNVPALAILLDRGAAHLLEGIDDHSLLAAAAFGGHLDAMRLLLDRGADLHAVGEDGLTPLAIAMREDRPEAVDLLRRAGATR